MAPISQVVQRAWRWKRSHQRPPTAATTRPQRMAGVFDSVAPPARSDPPRCERGAFFTTWAGAGGGLFFASSVACTTRRWDAEKRGLQVVSVRRGSGAIVCDPSGSTWSPDGYTVSMTLRSWGSTGNGSLATV